MFDIETARGFGLVIHVVWFTIFGKIEGSGSFRARV